MRFDEDIKLAGEKPSVNVRLNKIKEMDKDAYKPVTAAESANAKRLGETIAKKYIEQLSVPFFEDDGEQDSELARQSLLLLSFTATVSFEKYCKNDTLAGLAQKRFIDVLAANGGDPYKFSSDTGAFSFYYLAYRRGTDIERRMGQTFAMLCSHDGDPIFQERGEALYCWFSAEVRKAAFELKLFKV